MRAFCAAIVISASTCFAIGSAIAQSETKAAPLVNEQEYRDELNKWMLRAYEGDREAQFEVGLLFTNDQFDQPDFEQAVYWYKQAARQGHVLAQYNLGHQYITGEGVARNERTAMQWWLEAAKSDHGPAQFNVGRAYYLGIGLQEDHKLSRYWFEQAAANKESNSINILKQLGWNKGATTAQPSTAKDIVKDVVVAQNTLPEISEPSNPEDVDEDVVVAQRTLPATSAMRNPARATLSDNPASGKKTSTDLKSRITPVDIVQTEAITTDDLLKTNSTISDTPVINVAVVDVSAEDTHEIDQSKVTQQTSKPQTPADTQQNNPTATSIAATATTDKRFDNTNTESASKSSVALYTNPAVRSVLIAIVDDPDNLTISETGNDWYTVHSKTGFPVWIHGDFLKVDGTRGIVTGDLVNARSVPIITRGTVVGQFNRAEQVKILGTSDDWYRVIGPLRFKAWMKIDRPIGTYKIVKDSPKPIKKSGGWTHSLTRRPVPQNATQSKIQKPMALSVSKSVNDNTWLFDQAANYYTLQVASFDEPTKVLEFAARSKLIENPDLHQFTANSKDRNWTYFLYGSFPQKKIAESTRQDIGQQFAWIRTFRQLQENRCLTWKTQSPPPSELNEFCAQ